MPDAVHIPEVIEPDEKLPRDLVALRKFAYFMDQAFQIPGTRFRAGFDAVLGLIPGVGDVIGGAMSAWIVIGAIRHRVPARIVARMVLNIVIDLVFGAVPLAGDVFDFLFEENMKNMRLLEKHRNRRHPPRSTGEMTLIGILVFALIISIAISIVVGFIALVVWLLREVPWV
ncbi:MAG TPA: DUF4112 domain-containing protein [Thermoanaerobaculia bacterium]